MVRFTCGWARIWWTRCTAASYQLGSDANYAMLTRGGYIGPLFPTNLESCLNTFEVGNDVDSSMQVWDCAGSYQAAE